MQACSPEGNAYAPVDLRNLASAIPAIGLAPDAVARAAMHLGEPRRWPLNRVWAWQHGNTLIVLDRQSRNRWLLSELTFDHSYGYYLEERRVTYSSAREATGVALARTLRLGDEPALAAAAALDAWCTYALADSV